MTYQDFKSHMEVLCAFLDKQERFAQFIKDELATDSHKPIVTIGDELMGKYITMLEELSGDDGGWISYFLWDCDRGRRPMAWYLPNRKDVKPMRSIRDLWLAIKHDKK